ncbi:low molecular weight protein-tyrosine-phosphatase [Luteimonas sp. WGS1318]|uniref:low molecular weight protein-tyrosine-phosphatase n=1 Tax=Luteimonas sp. WGS1318 TaxID=3366815 RepID=UPI00372D1BB2
MAEGALRARIEAAGLQHRIVVDSCGTGDWHVGGPPDPRAVHTAAGHGVDIAGLCARVLEDADYTRFDALLCADDSTRRIVRARRPADATAEIDRLMAWAGLGEGDVPDPYTGDAEDFEAVWHRVDRAAVAIVDRLRASRASDRA